MKKGGPLGAIGHMMKGLKMRDIALETRECNIHKLCSCFVLLYSHNSLFPFLSCYRKLYDWGSHGS